ncbi:MAG: transposase [Bacteroidetes bacterium]|nr:MAG: transposase [Bacteroidota bacterium]
MYKMKAIAINGTEDHAHVLLFLPSTITIAKAIQVVKGGSSHWVHQTFPEYHDFEWQKGYGAFSVSHFDLDKIIAYTKNQKKHHAVEDSKTEYLDLLNKHQIEYDEKYILE